MVKKLFSVASLLIALCLIARGIINDDAVDAIVGCSALLLMRLNDIGR